MRETMGDANYDLKAAAAAAVEAPVLDYAPPSPRVFRPKIGLVGCGGISAHHLQAYRAAGWEVTAMHDVREDLAEARRREFFPGAKVCRSMGELLEGGLTDVVDLATHPEVRPALIEQAIAAGKHVLSQKPFVMDLDEGARLVKLADAAGVRLAVNQNGRWAPYFRYMRQAVRAGVIGEVATVNIALHWDHTWTAGTAYEDIHHLVLFDFGIHWFDAAYTFFGGGAARSVFATAERSPGQLLRPPLLAAAVATFEPGLASLSFNGHSRFGPMESCTVTGTRGTLRAMGPLCGISSVEVSTEAGSGTAVLAGSWFPDGFRGAMGELLVAIEEGREPENSAADNLKSLALCFGAMRSADAGQVVRL
jgi:predicted dehydrogenase